MPRIDISEVDFARLQNYAVPFIDTPATAITKVLNIIENGHFGETNGHTPLVDDNENDEILEFGEQNLPPLKHTKIMEASFNGELSNKNTWSAIVESALVEVLKIGGSVDKLKSVSGANICAAQKQDEGYKYLESHNFSYQGVSADDAMNIILRCTKWLKCELRIEFIWRDKPAAYKARRRGLITV